MLTICRLARCLNVAPARTDGPVRGFTIDSREAGPGDLFFALPGVATHGGEHAAEAEAAGAVAVVSRDYAEAGRLVVPDVRGALWAAAELRRAEFGGTVVAVTGSVGKTTTRRLLASVLRRVGETVESRQNFNNDLGVPLTLGRLGPHVRFAVVEVATSGKGEVAKLASLCRPHAAVVTAASPSHLDGLGDLAGVVREKASLAEHVAASGFVVHGGDRRLAVAIRHPAVVAAVSEDPRTDGDETTFRVSGATFTLRLPGRHFAACGAIAVTTARRLGVADKVIAAGLLEVPPEAGRCVPRDVGGVRLIDDAYNANPGSLAAAARLLVDTPARRRTLILGDMLGLGDAAERLHEDAGRSLPEKIERVVAVGPLAAIAAAASPARTLLASTPEQAAAACDARPGDAVLIKGSRATRMDRCVEALAKRLASVADA